MSVKTINKMKLKAGFYITPMANIIKYTQYLKKQSMKDQSWQA